MRRAAALWAAVLLGTPASAEYADPPRHGLTHAAQLGVEASGTLLFVTTTSPGSGGATAWVPGADLRVSWGLSPGGNELSARGRMMFFRDGVGGMLLAGYRVHFGREEWKTWAEIDGVLSLSPGPAGGAHLAGGVMWDPEPWIGASLGAGVTGAVGSRAVTVVELRGAVQLRF